MASPASPVMAPASGEEPTRSTQLAQRDAAGEAAAALALAQAEGPTDAAEREARAHAAAAAEPALRQRKKRAAKDMRYQEMVYEDYVRGRGVIIPIEKIVFDLEGKEGQARPMDRAILEQRRVDIILNPPVEPFQPHVWEKMPGGPFLALTNQHSIRASQMFAEERRDREAIPQWATVVKATVLVPETPLEVRKFIAGKFQGQQGSVVAVKLSRCATILLEINHEAPSLPLIDKMGTMIVRSGQPRAQATVCFLFFRTCEQLFLSEVRTTCQCHLFSCANKHLSIPCPLRRLQCKRRGPPSPTG